MNCMNLMQKMKRIMTKISQKRRQRNDKQRCKSEKREQMLKALKFKQQMRAVEN